MWTKSCKNCLLVRPALNSTEINSTSCWDYDRFSSPSGLNGSDQILHGLWSVCLCNCVPFVRTKTSNSLSDVVNFVLKAMFSLYATGSVALLVNITVVLVIVFNKSLRSDIAVLLICNIAVWDAVISISSVLYARFNFFRTLKEVQESGDNDDLLSKLRKQKNIMGPIFTHAVASQVWGTFMLTLEKFLKIVFAMKPDIRIGRRGSLLSLFLFCLLSVTFAILPAFHVENMEYIYGTPLPNDQHSMVGIATGVQIVLIIIQLTSLVLYVPIFIVAKRSGANVGIKREAALAKKIVPLVVTNFFFFTFPMLLGVFAIELLKSILHDNLTHSEEQWFLLLYFILPALCVSINSILNPFLVALRHPKIKRELKRIFIRCRTVLSESSAALLQHLGCHTNTVQQENEIEMRDVN